MSFATPQDVKDLFRVFANDPDAAVTDAKIQKWLDNAESEVLGKIGTLYKLPLNTTDNPLSVGIIAQIEAMKVAAIVDDILNNYTEADKKPNWDKRAWTLLSQYIPERDPKTNKYPDPTIKLPDAEFIGIVASTYAPVVIAPGNPWIFNKGQDNW